MPITSLSIVVFISYSIQNIKCARKPASRQYATGESRLRSGPLVSTSCACCRQARGGSHVERILAKNLRISLSARYLLPDCLKWLFEKLAYWTAVETPNV